MKTEKEKADEIVTRIAQTINALDKLKDSQDVVEIGKQCNDLAIASTFFAKLVSDAYDVANELEDEYKQSVLGATEKFSSAPDSLSFNRAEQKAKLENAQSCKDWTSAKNTYNRYKLRLDRIDRVLDSFKQYSSSVKAIDLKHG